MKASHVTERWSKIQNLFAGARKLDPLQREEFVAEACRDFRIRFQREAQATAALNHPHICALYDVGEHEGASYLVMEYVEVQTLASRLREGPLPLDQLLRRAAEVSQALAAAHERGIIPP